ncbi:DNA internalization-related competence protein ComEC/Rec2 [Zhaonella formicivorans]|uniref:DNA internalization-related competence protein ComEC/Rec2 n=1 Tax=Zhaonella formicivorans TaxID=2528593 RepID=UPI0010E01530|nr:DNA internalization-related competence protein ComEC/Rec2 [Zhaonella formicivorans]
MHRILVLAVCAYILGILAVRYNLLLFTLLFVGGLIYYVLVFLSLSPYKPVSTVLIIVLFFSAGLIRTAIVHQKINNLPPELGQETVMLGQIYAEPQVYGERTAYFVRIKTLGDHESDFKALLNILTPEPLPYRYGDYLRISGKLELPKRAKNPGEFDYRRYLERQGVLVQLNVRPDQVVLLKKASGNPFLNAALSAKNRVEQSVKSILPKKEADLFNSIFFGDKGLLTAEQKEMFSALGIMHVFAVSGSNVAVVLLVLLGLAILFKLAPLARNSMFVAGLLFYAAVTGFTPSVLRSTVMALGVLLAQWTLRQWDFYAGLAGAALFLLLWNPLMLFDSGFQLSFVVTWGLVYLTPLLEEALSFLPPWRTYLTVSLASQVAALPLTAYYFNIISLAALLMNLLVVPVIGITVILGMAVFLLALLWAPLAAPFIYSAGFLISILVRFLEWAGQYPWVALKTATPSMLLILSSYLCLVAVVELRKNKDISTRWFKLTLVFAALIFAVYLLPLPGHGKLEVTFLDVGQGDAVFIQTPGGKKILLDGGGENFAGTYNAGERVVEPYLTRRGVFTLDAVVNSHPDGDHLDGLFPVLKRVKTNFIITPPAAHFAAGYDEFLNLAEKLGYKHQELNRGDKLKLDGEKVVMEVLHPGDRPLPTDKSPDNNNSLVIRLTYGKVSFLLTGDLEAEGMAELMSQGVNLAATVLKIPHHGSRYGYDEAFYQKVSPRVVVFSVGKNNFGHPAPEITGYWEQEQVNIYRTDWDGAITFLTDGQSLTVNTMGREVRP